LTVLHSKAFGLTEKIGTMRMARIRYDREMCYYHLMNRVAGEPGYYPFGDVEKEKLFRLDPARKATCRPCPAGLYRCQAGFGAGESALKRRELAVKRRMACSARFGDMG
jgi:hypothetical protein